jgi:hypothetical protein
MAKPQLDLENEGLKHHPHLLGIGTGQRFPQPPQPTLRVDNLVFKGLSA